MRALRFQAYGPPSVLAYGAVADPVPGPGEVLVEVHASAINPSDVKVVGGAFNPGLPGIPGRDYSGTVTSAGAWLGKEVWGSGAGFGVSRDGAHAEFVAVPTAWLSEKPASLSMTQACAVGVPYVTAWSALITAADVQAGETVVIVGASGSVGSAAIDIARWKDAVVIAAARSDVLSGALATINTREQDLPTEVMALTKGRGADVVFDTVGGPMFEPALKSLGRNGRHIAITSVGNRRVTFDLVDFYHNRSHLIGVDTAQLSGGDIARIMDQLRPGFDSGRFKTPKVKEWPLSKGVEAYGIVAQGGLNQRLVLLPFTTTG